MRTAAWPRQIEDVTRGFTGAAVPARARRRVDGMLVRPDTYLTRTVPVLVGLVALAVYVLPWLPAPAAHWPLWDARVYWWGGRQAAAGGAALYAPSAPFSFTYPPFAALLFSAGASARADAINIAVTAGSLVALTALCGQALAAAGIRRRPEIVFAVSALALQTWPVAYTLHLGEVNLILAALIGTDLLRPRGDRGSVPAGRGLVAGHRDRAGRRDQAHPADLRGLPGADRQAAGGGGRGRDLRGHRRGGIRRAARPVPDVLARRGVLQPEPDRRPGQPVGPVAGRRDGPAGGHPDPPRQWCLVAVFAVGLAGLAVAVWAHRRGYRMAGFGCCAATGLLVSPISWTHHWVWAVPVLVWLITAAWRRRSTPLPWPGHPADPARMIASDLYVLFGLATLAAVGVALARARGPGATGGL